MSILIFSDLHLHDFRQYNLFDDPRFRLNQYDKLADRLVDIIDENNCTAVIIAGDFLHVASPAPYIVNAAGRFLKKLTNKVDVYVTHGQHDYDSRTLMSGDNTLLSLFSMNDKVHYLHEKSIELEGNKFYFKGWTPEQDFSHIPYNTYDILIGHATISNSVINQFGTKIEDGQEYDHDKFKLCFMGDIHCHQVIGNQIIPGPPIQTNFNDSPNNGVIVLNPDLTWKFIPTTNDKYQFLKMIVTDKEIDNPYIVTKLPASHELAEKKDKLYKSLDVNSIIKNAVESKQLSDLHQSVVVQANNPDEDLNLNFSVKSVYLKNYRSVDEYDWHPDKGITLIIGENGSGKSTLVSAMNFCFWGVKSSKTLVRTNQTEMEVAVSLVYNGINYKVRRGNTNGGGWVELYINDVLQESENQNSTNRKIQNELKFLEMYDLMYHAQRSPGFLSKYNYSSRVSLISKLINLSVVDSYLSAAQFLKKSNVTDKSVSINNELEATTKYIDSLSSIDFSDLNTDYESDLILKNRINTDLNEIINVESQLQLINNDIKTYQGIVDQYNDIDFTSVNSDNSELESELKLSKLTLEGYESELTSTQGKINDIKSQLSLSQTELINSNKMILDINGKMAKLTSNRCYACNSIIDDNKSTQMKKEFNSELNKLNSKILEIQSAVPNTMTKLSELMEEERKLEKDKSNELEKFNSIQSKLTSIDNLRTQYTKYSKSKSDLMSSINSKSKILTDLNEFKKKLNDRFNLVTNSYNETMELIVSNREAIASIKEKLSAQEKLKLLHNKFSESVQHVETLKSELSNLELLDKRWNEYINLMSPNGLVVRSVLTTVSEQMSSDSIKVVAHKELSSGELRPDFNMYMKVYDTWINYDELSGGQQTSCDIYLLSHLLSLAGGTGCMIFDESFAELSPTNLEYSVEILKEINAENVIIVSHHQSFPYYDSSIVAQLHNGVTQYYQN